MLASFETEAVRLPAVETLQVLSEIERADSESLLPPALHPTVPPVVTWLVQRVRESPWGPFLLAQCRIECRCGLRPRGFLRGGVIDNAKAGKELAGRWGYRLQDGELELKRSYDRIEATVLSRGQPILRLEMRDPTPIRPGDAYYVANMNLAQTPRGLRLVQVDPEFEVERAERGRPRVDCFDARAWTSQGVRPSYPVSALFTVAAVTLPRLRYICRPDVLGFVGTERVDGTG